MAGWPGTPCDALRPRSCRKALGSANRDRRVGRDDAIAKGRGRLAESIRAHDVAFDQFTLRLALLGETSAIKRCALVAREHVASAYGGPANDVVILARVDRHDGVGSDAVLLYDVGSDVLPNDGGGSDVLPHDVGADVVPVGGGGYSERGKELTAFEGLDHGSADGPGAAGHTDFLAAEE